MSWEFHSPTSESWIPFTPANNALIQKAAEEGSKSIYLSPLVAVDLRRLILRNESNGRVCSIRRTTPRAGKEQPGSVDGLCRRSNAFHLVDSPLESLQHPSTTLFHSQHCHQPSSEQQRGMLVPLFPRGSRFAQQWKQEEEAALAKVLHLIQAATLPTEMTLQQGGGGGNEGMRIRKIHELGEKLSKDELRIFLSQPPALLFPLIVAASHYIRKDQSEDGKAAASGMC